MTAKIHKLFAYLHFLILPILGSLDSSSTIGNICPRRVPQLKSFETEKETIFMTGNKTRKRVAFREEIFSHPHFWPFRSVVKAWWDEDWIVSRGKVIQKSSTIKALNNKFLQYFLFYNYDSFCNVYVRALLSIPIYSYEIAP